MAEEQELKILKRKRGSIKSQLTGFSRHLDTISSLEKLEQADVLNLKQRTSKIEVCLGDFENLHGQILELVDDDAVDEQYQEMVTFQENHSRVLAIAKVILSKYQSLADFEASVVNRSSSSNASLVDESQLQSNQPQIEPPLLARPSSIKLPELKLISFSGKYAEFMPFYDTFKSLIHDNQSLTSIQKFHYLRSCLHSEALQVIQNLELSSVNYEAAWSLLERRYKNKQLMIHTHIKGIVDYPKITKENFSALRELLDTFQNHVRSLKALQQPVEYWDSILIYLVADKFDYVTKKEWESLTVKEENLVDTDFLIDFVEQRCHLLEKVNKPPSSMSDAKGTHSTKSRSFNSKQTYLCTGGGSKCPICNESHAIFSCKKFLGMSVEQRKEELMQRRLCLNCMTAGHIAINCKYGKCKYCKGLHNSLIHLDRLQAKPQNKTTSVSEETKVTNTGQQSQATLSHQSSCQSMQQILPTAVIYIMDKAGQRHTCTALLDSGSMSNFITDDLCRRLELDVFDSNIPVLGLNKSRSCVTGKVNATIKSRFGHYEVALPFLKLPQITELMPAFYIDIKDIQLPKGMQLANERFNEPTKIDLLLGVDIFWDVIRSEERLSCPYLHNTLFGVVVSGSIPQNGSRQSRTLCNFSQSDLSTELRKFWEVEDCPPNFKLQSEEERFCELHFQKTTRRNSDGSFTVSLPLSGSLDTLGDSREQAEKRLLSLEKRFQSNHLFHNLYTEFMSEYEALGHMSKIDEAIDDSFYSFILPHHGVFKHDSLTTKLRVVFDGSCSSTTGVSINDLQMVGPTIQRDLFSILVSFRKHMYVLSADCTKMYRSVYVEERQRPLQRILWRFNSSEPMCIYNLNTITYGLSSSSFMAIRCLFQLAEECQHDFPQVADIIRKDMYVDDLLTGCDDINDASFICKKISEIFSAGGFQLRKWSSNEPKILQSIEDPDISCNILEFEPGGGSKTLGLFWSPVTDNLQFKLSINIDSNKTTKRNVLSIISQIFDPLGLVSPCTVTSKIFMQKLWSLNLSWDEDLPEDLRSQWAGYINDLMFLNELIIPRHISTRNVSTIEIHGFCDASNLAYGACVFLRCMDSSGNIRVRLVCSKTRVAPLKVLTIPRLELLGAQILCRLVGKVKESLGMVFHKQMYWCDSTIAISWINTRPHLLKTFVANRVADIQSKSDQAMWRFVPTRLNPADLLTRGVPPQELQNSVIWWNGPDFLHKHGESSWPSRPQPSSSDLPELKADTNKQGFIITHTSNGIEFNRFSSLTKLEHVTAYILRFISNCKVSKGNRQSGVLTYSEVNKARLSLIRLVQGEEFHDEIERIASGKPLHKKSKIINLNPFIHSDNTLRVGGRIKHSEFDFNKKHPYILPCKHHFTKLLIEREHIRLMHAGSQQLLFSIRDTYWPLGARNLVKKIVHSCISCFKCKPKSPSFLMGDLPKERVTPSYPFQYTGTDYAGPFLIKDRKGRGGKISKCYVCIFICFGTKAIHIELVSDLTTEAFILALRRFASRRCMPSKMFSDNGTNYIGANNQLNELGKFLNENCDEIESRCIKEHFNWQFIPAYSPHMGGIWEAGVKSLKTHLKRSIGNQILTFESLYSVLVQIEAVLNSRPLTPMTSNPSDLQALTPSHFLVGRLLTGVPDPDMTHIPVPRLSHYQQLQYTIQQFWKHWSTDYISQLQVRTKWTQNTASVKEGTLALIRDDNLPPLKWSLGRVERVHPGLDNVVRVVSLRTAKGIIKRSVAKICPLPIE